MAWTNITFDWNQARAFLVTAETGSFSAAARALGLTQPTLGRQVAALEETLGVTLFERVGRSLELTGSGRDLLAHVAQMGDAAQAVALSATGHAESIAGHVSVSVSDLLAAHVMPEVVALLRQSAPQIDLTIVASNDLSDLLRREADIAVRHVRPDQPDLVAKLVRETTGHLYAASSWLARVGRPETPQDLQDQPLVGMGNTADFVSAMQNMGLPVIDANIKVRSENAIVAWELARKGLGFCPMTRDLGDVTPGMEMVLPDLPPVTIPYWLVTHREVHTSRRIRVVFDMLAMILSEKDLPGKAW